MISGSNSEAYTPDEFQARMASDPVGDPVAAAAKLLQDIPVGQNHQSYHNPPPDAPAAEEPVESATAPVIDEKPAPAVATATAKAKAIAQMMRKQRALENERTQLKTGQAEMAKLREEMELMQKDPLAYLESKNPNIYSEFTQRKLNDGKPSPDEAIREVREEIKALREENQRLQETSTRSQHQQIINNAKSEITELLTDDNYELTRIHDAGDEILNLIALHFQETGSDLTIKDAADMIEKELESRVDRLITAKKLQSRLAGQKASPAQSNNGIAASKSSTPTLTNAMTGGTEPVDLSTMDTYSALRLLAQQIERAS